MTARRTFYLTTPIYYVNARPHLGHAYTTIIADAMCRYRRRAGDRVHFLTGTDEHGDKIAQAAAKVGLSPQAYADDVAAVFRDAWRRLGISNDDFIRTTEQRHQRVVQAILQRLWDAGEIYFGAYGGLYCFGCERFYTDKEAVDGQCPQHQTPLTFIEEENYFFRMSTYQDWLVGYIEGHPDLIRPERYRNEVLGFLREPLQDLSISRPTSRLTWGIPLPFDQRFVTYVWFDALINYVSALGGPGAPRFEELWPHAHHLIGKDILKPHAIYWPCMLKAAGLPVYQALHVHGYWNLGGGKMSKSIGNVVEAFQLTDKYGNDAFRYFLMREMTFGLDANFTEEALVGRLNSDLANDLGNLVSRVTTMIANFAGGVVPSAGVSEPQAVPMRQTLDGVCREIDLAMDEFAFQRALTAIWEFIAIANGFIDAVRPWALARDRSQRPNLDDALYTLAQTVGWLAILLEAFMPDAAGKIRLLFARWPEPVDTPTWEVVPAGTRVARADPLFPRVLPQFGDDNATVDAPVPPVVVEVKSPGSGSAGEAASPLPRIPVEDFAKVELRVAEVLAAERVAKSKKLLRLTVDVGESSPRTILAGIAEHYGRDDLVGRKIVVVANLQPATLMGVESDGMLLAGSADGKLAILSLDRDLPPGARVS